MKRMILAAALLVIPLAGCRSGDDDAAKDPLTRVMKARYLKATDELGSHVAESKLFLRAEGPDGVRSKQLLEQLRVDDSANYHIIRRRHDGDAPWELICVGSSYYVLNPEGSVESLQPGLLGQWTRERVAESWRTVLADFVPVIELVETGREEVAGRPVIVYRVNFLDGASPPEDAPTTPKALSGTLKLDELTHYPLSVELEGEYISHRHQQGNVKVSIESFGFELKNFGEVEPVKAPDVPEDA